MTAEQDRLMMDNPKDILKPVYGPEALQTFASILKIDKFTAEQAHQLQRAAWTFEFLNGSDKMRATRAERREAFQRIHDAAKKLKEVLENYNLMIVDDKADLPLSNTGLLDSLAEAAKQAVDSVPPTGADPKQARRAFVHDLGQIFMTATNKRPTLGRRADGQPYGRFFEFAEAALRQLDPHATQGVERDVAAIAADMKKLDS